ncbi:hypothetical protein IWZ01DRAFT_281580 [Phyllosticta capitalensis]
MEDRMMTCLSPRLTCMMQEKRSDLAGGQIIMQELANGRHVHRRIVMSGSLVTAAVSAPPPPSPPSPSGGTSSDKSRPPTEVTVITPDCCGQGQAARPCLSHAKIRGKRASAGRGRMPKCGEARSIEEDGAGARLHWTGHAQMRPYSGLSNTGDRPRSWLWMAWWNEERQTSVDDASGKVACTHAALALGWLWWYFTDRGRLQTGRYVWQQGGLAAGGGDRREEFFVSSRQAVAPDG